MPAVTAYGVCRTQWRTSMTGATGLDYPACIATLQLYLPCWQAQAPNDTPWSACTTAELLDDLRTIEDALLTAWDEQAEADRQKREPT